MTHGELQALFEAYVPWNEQERNDRELALQAFRSFDDLLTRENTILDHQQGSSAGVARLSSSV